jgi:hypothetical protein
MLHRLAIGFEILGVGVVYQDFCAFNVQYVNFVMKEHVKRVVGVKSQTIYACILKFFNRVPLDFSRGHVRLIC